MKSVFQGYVDALVDAPDTSTLSGAMEKVTAALDLPCFAYLMVPRHLHEVRLISNYPEKWTSHYVKSGYQNSDPVIDRVRRTTDPFEWGDGIWPKPLRSRESQFMDEAAQFGIRCGLTFPIHDQTCRYASVTFAADHASQGLHRGYFRHRQVLQLLAFLFHAQARKTLTPHRIVGSVSLSPREFECLEWAAKGKSAWDIGQIVGISRRTAAFHLENAKFKLGVRTIPQAVALLASARHLRR